MATSARSGRSLRRIVLISLLLLASAVFAALNRPSAVGELSSKIEDEAASAQRHLQNLVLGPVRVGLQVGHLYAEAHPEELARLRVSTGGSGGGVSEVDVNQAVARELALRLRARGIEVDVLPATVEPGYRADLLLAIHADSSAQSHRRGYKSAVFRPERNRWDVSLKQTIDEVYLAGSGLPDDDENVSGDMLEYYAFNSRFRHSASRRTPALIVELGYLSHPLDRRLLRQPDHVAALLEQGIVRFLDMRGRLDRGAG